MSMIIILLAITAILSNVLMDEVHTHYSRFFGKIIPERWQDWWDPALSWDNKYVSGSKVLTFIFSTILVWITDAWHFFKAVFLTCVVLIILLLENDALRWRQYGIELIAIAIIWGLVWELINGIIGSISDKLK